MKSFQIDFKSWFLVEKIKRITCEKLGWPLSVFNSKYRGSNEVFCRHVAIYITCMNTDLTIAKTGHIFNASDHSSITHARESMRDKVAMSKTVARLVKEIEDEVFSKKEDRHNRQVQAAPVNLYGKPNERSVGIN